MCCNVVKYEFITCTQRPSIWDQGVISVRINLPCVRATPGDDAPFSTLRSILLRVLNAAQADSKNVTLL